MALLLAASVDYGIIRIPAVNLISIDSSTSIDSLDDIRSKSS
ncbi:MAG: hypothetical protein QW071_06055 [Candidatus Bathyarchaeia archaeon]